MKIGSVDVSSVKIGSTDVNKIYIGSTEVWSAFTGLLDTYTGATAAYSLRQLSSSYSGSAIRVRRASDNTEQDIGFVSNELDVASLQSFCSGTDGFVTTWYDQSGNGNDASQSTAASQPQIVSSGNLVTENGKVSVQFDGSDDVLRTSNLSGSFDWLSIFSIHSRDTTNIAVLYNYGLDAGGTGDTDFSYLSSSSNVDECQLQFASISYIERLISTYPISSATNLQILSSVFNKSTASSANDQFIYQNSNLLSQIISTDNTPLSIQYKSKPFNIGSYGINNQIRFFDGNTQEIILYPSNQSSNRTGIETNINAQYNIYWDGSQTSLLDSYGGSAAAYSLRALSSSYTGALIKVRRASDNAEQDIYAKYDGTLNTDALESFCSGTDGFVTTWYDQSGNGYDATQTTASNQPQIVSSGSTILENGKPSVQFDGTDDTIYTAYAPSSNAMSVYNVYKSSNNASADTNTQTLYNFGNATVTGYGGKVSSTGFFSGEYITFNFNDERLGSSTYRRTTQVLEEEYWLTSGFSAYQNDVQYSFDLSQNWTTSTDSSPSALSFGTNYLSLGSLYVNSSFIGHSNINIQEVIFYPSDQSSNRSGIETNINNFYNIY